MANGDAIFVNSYREYQIKFLDAQVASDNGVWRDISTYPDRSLTVDQIEAGAKVEFMVLNTPGDTPPAGAVDGDVALTLTSLSLSGEVNGRFRWGKAKKTAAGGPVATTAVMVMTRNL
jgi:hypothetical protein